MTSVMTRLAQPRGGTIPRTISPEHQAALQRGREEKAKKARRSRARRVKAYRDWVKADAAKYRAYRVGDITREKWVAWIKANPAPDAPSDNDFKIIDGRMTDPSEKEAA